MKGGGGWRQQPARWLCDAFESTSLLCDLRAKDNSPRRNSLWIVPSAGRGHKMCIHEAGQLIPDRPDKALFQPPLHVSSTRKLPLDNSLDESSKVIFRSATKCQLVCVTENFTPLYPALIILLNFSLFLNARNIYYFHY